jgi:ABC-2 type transport system ATP-binding protein
MDSPAIIEAKNITKTYGQATAVNDLSLSVPEGVCFGLLGPNGAGKTTLIEIIEGILKPTAGEVRYKGRPRLASFKEQIGIMFQHTALLSFLTVRETLATFRSLYRHPAGMDQIIDLCHLGDIQSQYNDKLSGGQRQRLLLALALVNQPDLLFLDEPSTGLDPQARRNLWDIITRVKARGKTIILTTHYMEEAQQMCDDVAIIDRGSIIARGAPEELIASHARGVGIVLEERALERAGHPIPYETTRQGDHVIVHAEDMNRGVETLIECGVDLTGMNVHIPNLETVFLKLTGRRLRD